MLNTKLYIFSSSISTAVEIHRLEVLSYNNGMMYKYMLSEQLSSKVNSHRQGVRMDNFVLLRLESPLYWTESFLKWQTKPTKISLYHVRLALSCPYAILDPKGFQVGLECFVKAVNRQLKIFKV